LAGRGTVLLNLAQRLKPAFAYMHALCPCSQWAIEARVQLRQPVCFQCTEARVNRWICTYCSRTVFSQLLA
jgi:hypothetical protein